MSSRTLKEGAAAATAASYPSSSAAAVPLSVTERSQLPLPPPAPAETRESSATTLLRGPSPAFPPASSSRSLGDRPRGSAARALRPSRSSDSVPRRALRSSRSPPSSLLPAADSLDSEAAPRSASESDSSVSSQPLTTSVASSAQPARPEMVIPGLPVRMSAASFGAAVASKVARPHEVRSMTRRRGRERPRGRRSAEEEGDERPVQRAATTCFSEPDVERSTGSRERSLGLSLRSSRIRDVSDERSSTCFRFVLERGRAAG